MLYLDSSAIVKLLVPEPESPALRTYCRRRGPLVSSALARAEVSRVMLVAGPKGLNRAAKLLDRIDLIRVSNRVLDAAGRLLPERVRTLDAVHLVTAQMLGTELSAVCTYDVRMASAASETGLRVVAPA